MTDELKKYFEKHNIDKNSYREQLRLTYRVNPLPKGINGVIAEKYLSELKKEKRVNKAKADINSRNDDKKDIYNDVSLIGDLSKGISFTSLKNKYKESDALIIERLNNLKESGVNIEYRQGIYQIIKTIVPSNNRVESTWAGEKVIRFGVLGDTQLCSKFQQLTFLNSVYDLFRKEGIESVYHTGDITEGYNKGRHGHIYDLVPACIGADEQAEYVINNYPKREGITTHYISGNHDHWHITNGGVNIGKMISRERDDMKYLGMSNAVVELTQNCTMQLNHPEDGSSYAISYTSQKYADSLSGGQKPNILLQGHYHKFEYLFYRNIHIVQTGTLCAQTSWMRAKKIAAHVGAGIIEVHVNDVGEITRFKIEWIPQYHSVERDY